MTGFKTKNAHADGSTSRSEPSLEERALIRQWQEYKKVYLDQMGSNIPDSILSEMDSYLKNRSYLAGYHVTAADIQIFLSLYDYFVKEKFLNLARWFNHVQHLQHQRPLLTFSRTLLYN